MDIIGKFTKKSERSEKTWKDTKTYFSQRYELLKLELLEKSSQLLSVIFSMLIVIVCALAVLIYLSSAVIQWLTLALNAAWAYTIVCVLLIGIIIFVLAKKDALFIKPLIRKFSRILFPNEIEEVEGETVVKVEEEDSKEGGSDE